MRNLKTISRDECVINKSKDLEELFTFRNFPIYMGCTDTSISNDLKADMAWFISKSSGLIQLKNLVPEEILYANSHGSGSIGRIWDEHHKYFANFIKETITNGEILEIGGGHGILASYYLEDSNNKWTIVEPNPMPIKESKCKFVKGFFPESVPNSLKIGTIVHSHVFEHVFEPLEFINKISNFLKDNSKMIFSVPNMQKMLESKYTNCLNFEHSLFLTEPYIEYALSLNNFKIIRKKYFRDDHSIFYETVKQKVNLSNFDGENLYSTNKRIFLNFIKHYKDEVSKLNKIIENSNDEFFLFGAHVFSQYLFAFGLLEKKITNILDNDPNKTNKRLFGSNLFVKKPSILEGRDNVTVILKAGVYNEEVKNDIQKNINGKIKFI